MLKHTLVIFTLITFKLSAQYPGLQWVHSYGHNGSQYSAGKLIECFNNNILTVGEVIGPNIDFNPDPNISFNISKTSAGTKYYLTVLDTNQNFKWAKTIYSDNGLNASDVHIDESGNILLIGRFKGVLDADPDPLDTFNLHSTITPIPYQINNNPYIIKLDSLGNLIYAKHIPGVINRYVKSIRSGANGSVYIAGHSLGALDIIIDSDTLDLNNGSPGNASGFIIKLDSNGSYINHLVLPGHLSEMDMTDGAIYLSGSFSGIADFDPSAQSRNLNSAQGRWFIAQFDTSFNLQWAGNYGGTAFSTLLRGLKISNDRNIILTGNLSDSADFDPGLGSTIVNRNQTNFGFSDTYVLKLDSTGAFQWVKTISPSAISSIQIPNCLELDNSENIYVGGSFIGMVDLDPSPDSLIIKSEGTAHDFDHFLFKLDSQGNLVWGFGQGGSSEDKLADLSLDANNNIYLTGYFDGVVDFEPGPNVDTLSVSKFIPKSMVQKLGQCNDYTTDEIVSCAPFVWKDSITYTSSVDSVFMTYSRSNGCDSIVFLDLEILPTDSTIFDVTACDTFVWKNKYTFSQSVNWFPDTLVGSSGCDSILYLNLELGHVDTTFANHLACKSYTWVDSNTYYSDTLLYSNLHDITGCDSAVYLNLNFIKIDTLLRDSSGIILSSELGGDYYKWMDCSSNNIVHSSGTLPYYAPRVNGTYAAIIEKNGCIDTSECISISNLGKQAHSHSSISIFPNPANEVINIKNLVPDNFKLYLHSSQGQLVGTHLGNGISELTISVNALPAGVYHVKLVFDNQTPVQSSFVVMH